MQSPGRILLALVFALLGFSVAYLARPPAPKYFPLERSWHFSVPGEGPGMGWYGRSGVALVTGGVFAGIGYAVGRWRAARRTRELAPATIYALTALILAMLAALTGAIIYEQKPWFTKPAHDSGAANNDLAPDHSVSGE